MDGQPIDKIVAELERLGIPATRDSVRSWRSIVKASGVQLVRAPRQPNKPRTTRLKESIRKALLATELRKDSTRGEIKAWLQQHGITPSTSGITRLVNSMADNGELLRPGTFTRLDTTEARMRSALWRMKDKPIGDVLKHLQQQGVETNKQAVADLRRKMAAEGLDTPQVAARRGAPLGLGAPREPRKLPELTAEQAQVLERMNKYRPKLVAAIGKKYGFHHPENRDLAEQFDVDAEIQAIRAAASYNPAKGTTEETHLRNHLNGTALKVWRQHWAQTLGVGQTRAEKLPAVLKSLASGLTIPSIAVRHRISEAAAEDLIEKYNTHRRQVRLGPFEHKLTNPAGHE